MSRTAIATPSSTDQRKSSAPMRRAKAPRTRPGRRRATAAFARPRDKAGTAADPRRRHRAGALDGRRERAANAKRSVAPRRAVGAGLRRAADLVRVLAPEQRHEARHDGARVRDQPGHFRRAGDVVALAGAHRPRAHRRGPCVHRAREYRNAGEAVERGLRVRQRAERLPRRDPAQREQTAAALQPIRQRRAGRAQVRRSANRSRCRPRLRR